MSMFVNNSGCHCVLPTRHRRSINKSLVTDHTGRCLYGYQLDNPQDRSQSQNISMFSWNSCRSFLLQVCRFLLLWTPDSNWLALPTSVILLCLLRLSLSNLDEYNSRTFFGIRANSAPKYLRRVHRSWGSVRYSTHLDHIFWSGSDGADGILSRCNVFLQRCSR